MSNEFYKNEEDLYFNSQEIYDTLEYNRDVDDDVKSLFKKTSSRYKRQSRVSIITETDLEDMYDEMEDKVDVTEDKEQLKADAKEDKEKVKTN